MNVFEWVYDLCDELADQGHTVLANQVANLPTYVFSGETDRAEAVFPEIIAAAKSLGLPWLEVFARHFQMGVRFRQDHGEKALPEAVSLFEFAHREETHQCPQSVCTTQDLVRCYGRIDGPGYVMERKEAIEETMGRITPAWACFGCLSTEQAEALMDEGDYEGSAAYMRAQRDRLEQSGESLMTAFVDTMALAESLCGRHDAALALFETYPLDDEDDDVAEKNMRALTRAYVLAQAGQLEAARDALPTLDALLARSGVSTLWPKTVETLVAAGLYANDEDLGHQLRHALQRLEDGGCHHDATTVAEVLLRCAVRRGALWSAQNALSAFERARANLRNPARLEARAASLRALLAASPTPPAPVAADGLLEYLRNRPEGEAVDPEWGLLWLQEACRERPDDSDMLLTLAHVTKGQGGHAEADAVLRAYLERHPDDEAAWSGLLRMRLERNDLAAVEALIHDSAPHVPTFALYAQAHHAFRRDDFAQCIEHAEALLASDGTATGTRRLLVAAAQRLGQHELAVQHLTVLLAEDQTNDQWDLLVSATILGDATLAHECCQRLELPVEPGSMPPRWRDGNGGSCLVFYRNSQGREIPEYAFRFGPVSAEVYEVDHPAAPQRHKDVVVFDPAPMNTPPEDDAARAEWIAHYRHVHTLSEGGHESWFIDGPGPEDAQWDAFYEALREAGYAIWIGSGQDYTVTDSEQNETVPALYGYIATPKGSDPRVLSELLTQLTADWARPLSWLALAQAAKHNIAHHEAIVARFGL